MATQQEVLKTFMAALDKTTLKGATALDEAIKACSNFNSLQEFRDKLLNDCRNVGNSEKFLRDYCGIVIGNADTGAITGSDAENGTVKTAKSVVPESSDLINFTGDEFTVDGLTVKLARGGGTGTVQSRIFSNLSTQEKYIWKSLYTYWIKGGFDLISESYGENFSFTEKSSATSKTLYIIFDNSNNGVLASTWGGPDYAQKCTDDLELHINLYFYKSATGEDGIPSSNQNYLDRIISHELTHAVMRSNIDYFDYLPKWLKEGMAELTHGIDDKRTADLRTLAGNSYLLQRVFSGSSMVGVGAPSYSGGYLILRYLAKQAADTYVKNFSGTDANDQLETHKDSVTLSGGKGNDSLGNGFYSSASYSLQGGNNVSLSGGAGKDSLLNCAGNFVTLSGGAGNDTIINQGGNNVLIEYAEGDGNDSVVGFNETSTLSISGGVGETTKSGSDLIVSVGDGKITLTGATGLKTLNIFDRNTFFWELDDDDAAKVTIDSKVVTVDASSRTTAIRLVGNALDNSIFGGSGKDTIYGKDGNNYLEGNAGNDKLYGQVGDDTLHGGAGNDTLTGGEGNDLFIYTAGNDVIADYAAGEKISIGAEVSSASLNGANSVLIIGSGKLTVKNTKDLTLIDASGKELSTVIGTATYDNTADAKVTLDSAIEVGDASSRKTAIRIVGNELDNLILGGSKADTLYGKDGADYLVGNAGNDKLYGQNGDDTLHGGAGNDTLTGGDGNDLFIYSAGNDVIADYAAGDKISFGAEVSSASLNGANSVLIIGSGKLTVKNTKDLTLIDASGKELSTVIGSTIYDDNSAAKVTLDSGIEIGDATARTTAIKIVGNALDNVIYGGSGKDTLYGADGNDYLVGNAGNDKLYGQIGDDTLHGGAGNDTLTGGEGNDLFIYTAGNDVIADYASGDKISLDAAISKSSVKGSDATFTIEGNTLKIKDGKGAEIVFIDADGKERTIIGGAFVATNSTSAKNTLAAWREVADATARTTAIRIVGNALNNSILGGSGKDSLYGVNGADYLVGNAGNDKLYGQNGNDTLWGGAGNDTLNGGAGADTFIYNAGDGKDVITGFADDDLLQITEGYSISYNAAANSFAFNVGSGSVTLKNFTATTLNVNGTAFQVKNFTGK